jgi:basic membrane protein A
LRPKVRVTKAAVIAGIAVPALVLAACGKKNDTTTTTPGASTSATTSAAAAAYKACMITDIGGIDDKSFNASAWQGMQAAQSSGKATVSYVASKTEADYKTNINSLLTQKCNVIVTVGGLMGQATTDAAKANPTQNFIEVDYPGTGTNFKGLQFNTVEAAFQAGYLAAGYSKTGKVATYGGLKIAPVTIFMDGFQEGVEYYNTQKGKKVQLLGWDKAKQNGVFVSTTGNPFNDQTAGQKLANNFIAQGADVIMPVAGGTGLGTAAVAKSGGKASIIWVDVDGTISASQYADVIMTSVEKHMAKVVQDAVEAASGGTFDATGYIGTLANDGIGLAPYHSYDSKIDAGLKADVDKIKADIIAGTIKPASAASPK